MRSERGTDVTKRPDGRQREPGAEGARGSDAVRRGAPAAATRPPVASQRRTAATRDVSLNRAAEAPRSRVDPARACRASRPRRGLLSPRHCHRIFTIGRKSSCDDQLGSTLSGAPHAMAARITVRQRSLLALVAGRGACARRRNCARFRLAGAPPDNPTTPEKVALGRLLFWDPDPLGHEGCRLRDVPPSRLRIRREHRTFRLASTAWAWAPTGSSRRTTRFR